MSYFTNLPYSVVSGRTGATVAAFMLNKDAQDYAEMLEKREGPNGVIYRVVST
jgi:hypothetical protein